MKIQGLSPNIQALINQVGVGKPKTGGPETDAKPKVTAENSLKTGGGDIKNLRDPRLPSFRVENNELIVSVIDAKTDKVIREMPSKEIRRIRQVMDSMAEAGKSLQQNKTIDSKV